MAYDINLDTYITEYYATYPNRLDQYEFRNPNFGLLNMLIQQQKSPKSIISNDVRELVRNTYGSTVKVPVMNNDVKITLGNKRTCDITCPDGSTALVDISTVVLTADICVIPAVYKNNRISAQESFNRQYEAMIQAFGKAFETIGLTALETAKNGVYSADNIVGDDGFIPLVGDTMQVPAAEIPEFFNWLQAIQEEDGFGDIINVVGSNTLRPQVKFLEAQGAANSTNYAFQFNNWNFDFTNSIKDGVGMLGTGFIFPEGAIGFVTQNAPDNIANNYASRQGINYYTRTLSEFGLLFDVINYTECTDLSGIQGLEAFTNVVGEKWQFAINFGVVTPYLSDPLNTASPIRKFEFVNSKITPTPPTPPAGV